MKYSNPKIPEGINYSKENPLKEFFLLAVSVSLVLLSFVIAVYLLAQSFAHHIPFKYESKLVSANIQQNLFEDELNTKKQEYIANLGDELAKNMDLPDEIRLQIYYGDDEIINAFASLNGLIVINQGLIDFVHSENELAFILAHEIAHIQERHPIKSLSSGLIVSVALSAIVGSDMSGAAASLGNAAMLGALSFSRDNELTADGIALLAVQRYYGHTSGSSDFFLRMQEQQDSPELLNFLSTHPGHQNRILQIENQIKSQNQRLAEPSLTPLPAFMQQPKVDLP